LQKGINVITEKIQVSQMQMMATGGGVPPEQFFKALETHPNLGAVVLFLGFPQLTDSELEVLKKTGSRSWSRARFVRATGDSSSVRRSI